ncbi:MAG TPA: cysteine methyltransferase, partial [Xanthobacteraceae bacterium]|nr:cysteine methyltransferase [Xanthobacteraceae bacterium]
MAEHGFTLFDTEIGRCGIAWGDHGLVALQLPERDESRTRA